MTVYSVLRATRCTFLARPAVWMAVLLALPLGATLGGCSTNPTTGRLQYEAISPEQEIALGNQAAPELTAEYGGAVTDPALTGYIQQVGRAMVPHTEGDAPALPWEFVLLDSDVINAFALPGGKVFMSRGLAERMTNEAQLASVLGHEIGHVTARHVNDRIASSMVVSGLMSVGGLLIGASTDSAMIADAAQQIVGAGGQGYLLKFNRDQEHEADELGVRYMVRAGYNPRGAVQVQEVLRDASEGERPPEILSTHPLPESRIRNLKSYILDEYAFALDAPEYQFFEGRFKSAFLDRVSLLPPPADARTFELAAVEWCSVCREQATR